MRTKTKLPERPWSRHHKGTPSMEWLRRRYRKVGTHIPFRAWVREEAKSDWLPGTKLKQILGIVDEKERATKRRWRKEQVAMRAARRRALQAKGRPKARKGARGRKRRGKSSQ
jgi:hypothetical protein